MRRSFAKSILSLAAAMMIMSGCTQDAILEETQVNNAKVFTASIGDVTRTTLDQSGEESNFGKVYWKSGDEVSINGVIYVATPGSDATTATLEKKTESDPDPEAPYIACYPASIWNGDEAVFPTQQQYASGGDLSGVSPMKAVSETTDLSFKNMGALVEMTIKGESTDKVQFINLGSIRLFCGFEGVALSENGSKFYIAVPAGEYEDLPLNVLLTNGKYFEDKSHDVVKLEKSKIYTLTLAIVFKEIEGVQLWKDGPYWAPTNIGAANAWDYGLYFEWGNIIGYAPNGESFSHSFNETDYAKTPGAELVGDIKTAAYDAAMANWGGKWRMPTKEEFEALLDNCDRKWHDGMESQYDGVTVAGYEFTGRGDYSGNSIFLPAAGRGLGSELRQAGSRVFYRSTFRFNNSCSSYLHGDKTGATIHAYIGNYCGFPVRPVSD